MQRNAVHTVAHALHEHLCPVPIVVAGAARNLVEPVAVVVAAVGGIASVEVGVILRLHVATASPTLVAHAEELHLPCLFASVLPAQFRHRGVAVARHVLHPFGKFLHRAAAHVAADVGFASEHLAEVEEFVRTEGVVLNGSAPVVVLHLGSLAARTYAVHPVILVGKAATGPSEHRHMQVLECAEHILAVAVDVGNRRVFAHPQTAVDARTEMFGKLSVDFLVYLMCALTGVHGHCRVLRHGSESHACRKSECCKSLFHNDSVDNFY